MFEVAMYIISFLIVVLISLPWVMIFFMPISILGASFVNWLVYLIETSSLFYSKDKPLNILVADDDYISVAPLLFALSNKDANVQLTDSGAGALEELGKKQYDLVIIDYHMKDQTGDELLRRSDAENSNHKVTPVIIYTNYAHEFKMAKLSGLEHLKHFIVKDIWDKKLSGFDLLHQVELITKFTKLRHAEV